MHFVIWIYLNPHHTLLILTNWQHRSSRRDSSFSLYPSLSPFSSSTHQPSPLPNPSLYHRPLSPSICNSTKNIHNHSPALVRKYHNPIRPSLISTLHCTKYALVVLSLMLGSVLWPAHGAPLLCSSSTFVGTVHSIFEHFSHSASWWMKRSPWVCLDSIAPSMSRWTWHHRQYLPHKLTASSISSSAPRSKTLPCRFKLFEIPSKQMAY